MIFQMLIQFMIILWMIYKEYKMIDKDDDKIYDEWNKIFFDFLNKMPIWKNR